MSKSSPAPLPPESWSILARFGSTGAPAFAWKRYSDTGSAALSRFLQPLPLPTPDFAPCPHCSAARRLSRIPDGTFVMEQPDGCSARKPKRGIVADDVKPIGLDFSALAKEMATRLGITPAARVPEHPGILLPLGTFARGHESLPVLLALTDDPGADPHAACFSRITAPAIILMPVANPEDLIRLRARHLMPVALSSVLQLWDDGRLQAPTPLPHVYEELLAGHEARAPRDPLPLRGKRYEIAPDYTAVTRLGRKPHRELISNVITRFALQVLVESGAGSEGAALPKAQFVKLVHDKTSRSTPAPAETRPQHYFRRSVGRRMKSYRFYSEIFRMSDSGGLYWLEL
jgi:hypothetical protein